ncbi:hypothetical protein VTO42DRAFT_7522 [Malbranchea cinnamomea]
MPPGTSAAVGLNTQMEVDSQHSSTHSDRAKGAYCDHTQSPPTPDHTCHHPYHSQYSNNNLPPLLFQLDPPDHTASGDIGFLIENGEWILDSEGRPVRDFPFLPRHIAVRPPAWLLEYWMRTDSRLTYRDIKARMIGSHANLPSDNVLNMRREREARLPLGLSCWTSRRGGITKAEVERVEKLTDDQIAYNTTMIVEYTANPDGSGKKPVCLRSKSIKSSSFKRFPLTTFLNSDTELHTPSSRLTATIDLLQELQSTATTLGIENWRNLPAELLPAAWVRKREKNKRNATTDKYQKAGKSNYRKTAVAYPESRRHSVTHDPLHQNVYPDIPDNTSSDYFSNASNATQSGLRNRRRSGPSSIVYGAKTRANALPAQSQYTSMRAPCANFPKTPAERAARISIAALTRLEPEAELTPDQNLTTQTNKPKCIPIDPRLVDSTPGMETEVAGRNTDSSGLRPAPTHRFNSAEAWSVNRYKYHAMNTDLLEAMDHNNPFSRFRQPSVGRQSSFDEFISALGRY